MNRSSIASTLQGCAVLLALVLMAVLIVPASAQAQDSSGVSLSLRVSPDSPDQPFRTVAVALDPGTSGLAALGATLSYDRSAVQVSDCSVSEVGACNVNDADGVVLVSVFNLSGLRQNDQLLTISFTPIAGATGPAVFEAGTTTAVTSRGERIEDVINDRLVVELASDGTAVSGPTTAAFGSLTGNVVEADYNTSLYAIELCVTHDDTAAQTCTATTGLGNWRFDDIETGSYSVVATDVSGVYAPGSASGVVTEGEIGSVDEIVLAVVTAEDAEGAEVDEIEGGQVDDAPDEESEDPPATVPSGSDGPLTISYQATIAGQVTGLETELPIEALQVCATQPVVLHQSCGTTDATGTFDLSGLSAGNYWIEIVDPLGRFEQTRPKLVGVLGDRTVRDGVEIALPFAE